MLKEALHRNEDGIVWQDVEDKDNSDWVDSTNNDLVMSDYGKFDE
jgi:hypothetical protein